jgi:hypothetical protein
MFALISAYFVKKYFRICLVTIHFGLYNFFQVDGISIVVSSSILFILVFVRLRGILQRRSLVIGTLAGSRQMISVGKLFERLVTRFESVHRLWWRFWPCFQVRIVLRYTVGYLRRGHTWSPHQHCFCARFYDSDLTETSTCSRIFFVQFENACVTL